MLAATTGGERDEMGTTGVLLLLLLLWSREVLKLVSVLAAYHYQHYEEH